jgi:ketosteroid isomerase-like protein
VPFSAEARGIAARPIEGAANIIETIMTVTPALYADGEYKIQAIVADDETGAVLAELDAKLASNGEPYRNAYTFIYRFANGKITEIWESVDTDYAYSMFLPNE